MLLAVTTMLQFAKPLCKFHPSTNIIFNYNLRSIMVCSINLQKELVKSKKETSNQNSFIKTKSVENVANDLGVSPHEPLFPEVVHEVKTEIGFWNTESGLKLKDQLWTASGRLLRTTIFTVEKYDNLWETAMSRKVKYLKRKNKLDKKIYANEGPEVALCHFVLKLKGAYKLIDEDIWIDSKQKFLTQNGCSIEAIDLRNSVLSHDGMAYFEETAYLKYLNVADSPAFDNYCMTNLNALTHSLEYLDISGTSVTPEAFSYFKLFSKLRWLNISRLANIDKLELVLPFLRKILPKDCVIIYGDILPSEGYGTNLNKLISSGSSADLVEVDSLKIGDLPAFYLQYNFNALEVIDVSTIYQLWKVPKIDEIRRKTLQGFKPKEKSTIMTAVEYIHKANQFKPLF